MATMSDVLQEIECPVCHEYITTQIPMCVKGHSICAPCKERCRMCPVCKAPFGDTRNYAMENIIAAMKIPCRNHENGCKFLGNVKVFLSHMEECFFNLYACPLQDTIQCSWMGRIKEMKTHLNCDIIHNSLNTPYISRSIFTATMFKYGFNAIFKIFRSYCVQKGTVKWAVQYIGPKHKVKNFRFRVEFTDRRNKFCDLIFISKCIPICQQLDVFKRNHVEVNIDLLKHYQDKGQFEHKLIILNDEN